MVELRIFVSGKMLFIKVWKGFIGSAHRHTKVIQSVRAIEYLSIFVNGISSIVFANIFSLFDDKYIFFCYFVNINFWHRYHIFIVVTFVKITFIVGILTLRNNLAYNKRQFFIISGVSRSVCIVLILSVCMKMIETDLCFNPELN